MDSSTIASLATHMSNVQLQQSTSVAVLKKAMEIQEQGALQLLQAIPPMPTLSSSGGVAGQVINVSV
ncbi:MAG TPA: YjfB family protein [Dongiaceae bacterium]|nr:YjfB family protein [Dongiaceae bacterium]